MATDALRPAAPSITPDTQRRGPLVIYGHYRIILAAALVLLFVIDIDRTMRLGSYLPDLYLGVSVAYFTLCVLTTLATRLIDGHENEKGFALIGIDIIALTLLVHSSGGPASNVAPLIVVTVAAGAILLPGRLALLPAAVAALAMLYEQSYFSLSRGLPLVHGSTQVGLLGIAFFGVAIATARVTRLLAESEALSRQRQQQVDTLRELNAHIIRRMRTGILVVDEQGNIRLHNGAAALLLTGKQELQDGMPLAGLSMALQARLADWRANGPMSRIVLRSEYDGAELAISMTAITIGRTEAVLVFIEDMTALGQHLQQMKLASLGRLAASIAHEIRNPLSAISHAAQLMNESRHLDPGDARLLAIVQKQSLRLDRIVEDVLQLSRRQPPRTEPTDLCAWVRDFHAEYLAGQPGSGRIEARFHVPMVQARFDPNQFSQVLQNLCDNGLRHGRQLSGEGEVTLTVGLDEQTGQPWLHVADNGPGIPEERLDNLFEPFFTTEAGGTGLGLYLARELCEANRARIIYVANAGGPPCGRGFLITFSHPGRIAS